MSYSIICYVCPRVYTCVSLPYRTESFSKYSRNGVGPLGGNNNHPDTREEPVYSTLTPDTMDPPHLYPEAIALGHIHHDSSENLIIPEGVDGMMQAQSRPQLPRYSAEAYMIPVSSQENLSSPDPGSVGHFPAMKRYPSNTSGYNSTNHLVSPVQKMPDPHSSDSSTDVSSKAVSATNPWNDYEQIDCLLYTSPSPRDATLSRMPSSA